MLGAEQAYEGLYGQGPPSVSSHGGRPFQQGMCLSHFINFFVYGKWTKKPEIVLFLLIVGLYWDAYWGYY